MGGGWGPLREAGCCASGPELIPADPRGSALLLLILAAQRPTSPTGGELCYSHSSDEETAAERGQHRPGAQRQGGVGWDCEQVPDQVLPVSAGDTVARRQ